MGASPNRFLFTTTIDGPWENQPTLITYADDGKYLQSVVRIEILSEDQVPTWHIENGHVGWVGTTEAKQRAPVLVSFIGFLLIVLNVVAPSKRKPSNDEAGQESPRPVVT